MKYLLIILLLKFDSLAYGQMYFSKYKQLKNIQEKESSPLLLSSDSTRSLIITSSAAESSNPYIWSYSAREISNDNGEILRTNQYSLHPKFTIEPSSFIINSSDNYLITGLVDKNDQSSINKSGDIYLSEINKHGEIQWAKSIGNENTREWGTEIVQTENGGYIIGGWKYENPNGNRQEAFVMKISSTGDSLWTRIIPNPNPGGETIGLALAKGDFNSVYFAYGKTTFATDSSYFAITKFDGETGLEYWNKDYPIGLNGVSNILVENDGSLIIYGILNFPEKNKCSPAIWKISSDGEILEQISYFEGIKCGVDASGLKRTNEGGYAFVLGEDHYPRLVVLDNKFNIIYTKLYEIELYMSPTGFRQLEDNSFIIVGYEGATLDYTVWLLRTDPNGNLVLAIGPEVNRNSILIYPNPASDFINLVGDFPKDVEINIANTNGQIVLKNCSFNSIDLTSLPSGVYFVNLISQNEIFSIQKIIKK